MLAEAPSDVEALEALIAQRAKLHWSGWTGLGCIAFFPF